MRLFQRFLLNPVVKTVVRLRVPLGWCLLETTGRRTGRRRRVPVGNGLEGSTFWIVTEHGDHAGYVRNLRADPHVNVLVRRSGLRMRWWPGRATVLDDDDPYARQRTLGGWRHPLRALNAMVVRVLGTELRTIRIDLAPEPRSSTPTATAPSVGQPATPSLKQ